MKTDWLVETRVGDGFFHVEVDWKSWGLGFRVRWHRYWSGRLSLDARVQVGPLSIGYLR